MLTNTLLAILWSSVRALVHQTLTSLPNLPYLDKQSL